MTTLSKPLTPSALARTLGVIGAAIAQRSAVTIVYVKPNSIVQVRVIEPHHIETCANGNVIVRAICLHSDDWRSFSVEGVKAATPGHADPSITL